MTLWAKCYIFTFLFYFLGALSLRIGLLWFLNAIEIFEIYIEVLSYFTVF